jgi:NADH-quinone oxidoreductase subunit M
MENLLSIITFLPLVAALILALFLRGDDALRQRNGAKWLALFTTTATFLISLFCCSGSIRRTPASSSSRSGPGSWG